ncbi:hypothetical protein ABOB24_26050, partial [Escherichia coli]
WVWAAGQGYDKFRNKLSDLTNDSTRLVMNADEYMPILVGKTSRAIVGREGVTPGISLADANGKVTASWDSNGRARGRLQIAANGSDGTQIGVLSIPVTGVGVIAQAPKTGMDTIIVEHTRRGVFAPALGRFWAAPHFSEIDNEFIGAYGGPTIGELVEQLKFYNNNLKTPNVDYSSLYPEIKLTNPDKVYSGAYALGIPIGEQIVLDFNQKLSSETVWNAPLTVQVTYQ